MEENNFGHLGQLNTPTGTPAETPSVNMGQGAGNILPNATPIDFAKHANNGPSLLEILEKEGENDANAGRNAAPNAEPNGEDEPAADGEEKTEAKTDGSDPKKGKIVPDAKFYKRTGMMRGKINDIVAKRFIGWLKNDPEWHTMHHISGDDHEFLSEAWGYYLMSNGKIYSPLQYLVEANIVVYGAWFAEAIWIKIGTLFKRKPKPQPKPQEETHTYQPYPQQQEAPQQPMEKPQFVHANAAGYQVDQRPPIVKCLNCGIEYPENTGYPKNPTLDDYGKYHSQSCWATSKNKSKETGRGAAGKGQPEKTKKAKK